MTAAEVLRSDESTVERVLVVSKTHLDVGFTDLAAVVRRRYLDDFFPRAMAVAAELRARGGAARLRWTTGSWILTEALDAADATGRRALDEAIEAGDLCWHALPFTLHTEYCDRSLVEHGLSLAAELDRRYGRRTRAAKVTDVPGHTRGLVSVLADAGVDLLHVGVNPASAAPSVPRQFRWRDDAAARPATTPAPEVVVMYQPGGYGAVQTVAGTRTAVAVELTGDNLGPPSLDDVVGRFDELAQRFPGAVVEAATFDDVAALMASVRHDLPLVTAEIGDTWIHGVGSDPAKTTAFRALCRQRRLWLDDGLVTADDPALRRASTRLLLVAEHTWGMDLKTHWPDEVSWGEADLAVARTEPATRRFESSWEEQRGYLAEFVAELRAGGRDDLADRAVSCLDAATADRANPAAGPPDGPVEVDPTSPVRIGAFEVAIDPLDGAVVHCVGPGGRELAAEASPLGRLRLQTFDAADFGRWFSTYNASTSEQDQWWARWDNTKPGLDGSGARSQIWEPRLVRLRRERRDGAEVLVAELAFDVEGSDPVAVPSRLDLTVRAGAAPGELELALSWSGLVAARWPVAWWWSFAPLTADPSEWLMEKLGEPVSPFDVVAGGGRHLHAADRLVHPDGAELRLLDAPLVAPGHRRALDWDAAPVDLAGGWHVCVYANLWGTNFPMWIEGHGCARVVLRAGGRRAGSTDQR